MPPGTRPGIRDPGSEVQTFALALIPAIVRILACVGPESSPLTFLVSASRVGVGLLRVRRQRGKHLLLTFYNLVHNHQLCLEAAYICFQSKLGHGRGSHCPQLAAWPAACQIIIPIDLKLICTKTGSPPSYHKS